MASGWREQYDRVNRWHARIVGSTSFEPRDVDDFYAFFVCCFHLKDWLKNDPSLDRGIGCAAEVFIKTRTVALQLCADVANGSKHFVIDKYVRHSSDARVERLLADSDISLDLPVSPDQECSSCMPMASHGLHSGSLIGVFRSGRSS
jgi:hypothetical protein